MQLQHIPTIYDLPASQVTQLYQPKSRWVDPAIVIAPMEPAQRLEHTGFPKEGEARRYHKLATKLRPGQKFGIIANSSS